MDNHHQGVFEVENFHESASQQLKIEVVQENRTNYGEINNHETNPESSIRTTPQKEAFGEHSRPQSQQKNDLEREEQIFEESQKIKTQEEKNEEEQHQEQELIIRNEKKEVGLLQEQVIKNEEKQQEIINMISREVEERKIEEKAAPKFDNLQDAFESITTFFSATKENVQKSTKNATEVANLLLNNRKEKIIGDLTQRNSSITLLKPSQETEKGEPIVITPKTEKKHVPEPPKFNSLQEAFGSITCFFTTTKENIQNQPITSISKASDIITIVQKAKDKIKNINNGKDSEEQTHLEKGPEIIKDDDYQMRIDRMEEVRRVKPLESQAQLLKQELEELERNVNQMAKKAEAQELKPVKVVRKIKANEIKEPLFMKMEKKYLEKVVFPELEKRKEDLKAKREFFKPINDKELREHAIKYQEAVKLNAVQKQYDRLEKEKVTQKPSNYYKSHALQKVMEEEREEKERQDKKVEQRKLLKDKQLQYGKLVKEMYFPKIDNGALSKENLRHIIEKSEKAEAVPLKYVSPKDYSEIFKSKARITRMSNEFKRKPVDYVYEKSPETDKVYDHKGYLYRRKAGKQSSPGRINDEKREDPSDYIKENLVRSRRSSIQDEVRKSQRAERIKPSPFKKEKSAERETFRSMKDREREKEKEKEQEVVPVKKNYPNYLEEIKRKRIEQERKGIKVKYTSWEKHLNKKGVSQKEKMLTILDEVQRMELKVKQKEERLRQLDIPRNAEPLEIEEEVGEMYLEAIKAKLAIIRGLE